MGARHALGSGKPALAQPAAHSWLVALRRWLGHEGHFLLAVARESALVASLLVGLLLWSIAYQIPFTTTLHIGGDSVSHRREDDAPFLQGFHGSQPKVDAIDWWTLEPGYGYRWTRPEASVELPGIGGGRWLLSVTASSGRADGTPAPSRWQLGTQQLAPLIDPAPRVYRFLIDASSSGNIDLHIQTPRYLPPNNDPRELGFVISRIVVAPATPQLRLPALGQLGWLLVALALVYISCRRLGLAISDTLVLALLCGGGLALLLVYQRLPLTIFTSVGVTVLAACYGLAITLTAVARPWIIDPVQPSGVQRASPLLWSPIPLIVLGFALRLGGLFHPHTLINDIGLHANNMLELSLGKVFFTEGLPSDAGGGQSPYPPGSYLLLLPFQIVMQPSMGYRIALLNIGTALTDSLVIGLIWLMLWRGGFGVRAAWWGAALYLAPPPLLASFSIGEAANIGGQALALPVLALLSLATPESTWRDGWRWLLPFLCIALIGHMGVTISLGCLLVAVWIQVAFSARWRQQFGRLTVVGLVAALAVGLFYYSVPLFTTIFAERLGSTATPPVNGSTSSWLRVAGRTATLFTPGNRITPLLTVAGLVGTILISVRGTSPAVPLLLRGWWLGTLLSLGLLLVAQQGVREQHFLYPALCLGAGPLLAALWQRGRAGRVAALMGLLLPITFGALFWVRQLVDYLH